VVESVFGYRFAVDRHHSVAGNAAAARAEAHEGKENGA
jgi:hypothetical protein